MVAWRLVIGESGTRETTRESYSGRQRPDDWVPHAIATPYVLVAQLFSQHRTELAISRASSRTSACNSTESNAAAESDKVADRKDDPAKDPEQYGYERGL